MENLKMSAECETEEKTEDEQKYVSAKNGAPVQVNFSAILSAALGIDVKEEVASALHSAQRSVQDYFYMGGTKLFPFKLMMVKAETEEIQTAPSGVWVYAKVNVTLKQSTNEWLSGQMQKETVSDMKNGGPISGPGGSESKTELKYVKPISSISGATILAPAGSYAKTVKEFNVARAIIASQNVTSAAKSVASAVSSNKPTTNNQSLTSTQKARAEAKVGYLLGIK